MKKHPLSGLDADIREHIEEEIRDNIERGMPPEEARHAALRKFGNVTRVQEDTRAVWLPLLLEQFIQDVRYALTTMRRQPGFSIAAISMLTIGLGLVAGGYTVFNGLFIRGWAVPDNAQVFDTYSERTAAPATGYVLDGFSIGAYNYVRSHAKSADYFARKIEYLSVNADGGSKGIHTYGIFASDNVIEALRIPLQLGAGFGRVARPSEPRILVSDSIWRRVFNADPNIIGRTAWLRGVPTTIVGVTARGFDGLGGRPLDLIVEMSSSSAWERLATPTVDGTACCIALAGRIREGWTRPQVHEELALLTAQYRQSTGQPALSVTLTGTAAGDSLSRRSNGDVIGITLALIGAAIVLVLLLTCANVGNLYLAKSLRRKRELAVRLSLGASRARVVRQLLTEGLVMAVAAGICAFLMTTGVPLLLRLVEENATATMFASDWRVAAFTAAGVVMTCLLVSLAPALQATRIAWRGATTTMSARTGRLRGLVLATQIAIAAVLVLSATLLARGIGHAVSVPSDFALNSTTAVTLEPRTPQPYDRKRMESLGADLARAAQDDGLRVGIAGRIPASGHAGYPTSIQLSRSELVFSSTLVQLDASALAVLNLTLVSGHLASDDPAAGEAVINETLARQISPGESALGKAFRLNFDGSTRSIVGIVRDAHLTSLSEVEPMVHVAGISGFPILLVRTSPGQAQRIKAIVASVDPTLTVTLTPLSQTVRETLQNARIGAAIAASLGAVALLLSIIGVFGVFSYLIEERRHEIGIRLALGASRAQIGAALFRASRGPVAGGLIAGLTLSALAGLALRRFLFGLSPVDPVSYLLVAIVLGTAALAATAVPVRRALRIDPAVTLRAD